MEGWTRTSNHPSCPLMESDHRPPVKSRLLIPSAKEAYLPFNCAYTGIRSVGVTACVSLGCSDLAGTSTLRVTSLGDLFRIFNPSVRARMMKGSNLRHLSVLRVSNPLTYHSPNHPDSLHMSPRRKSSCV